MVKGQNFSTLYGKKVDFSPISCKKALFYTRNGLRSIINLAHAFKSPFLDIEITIVHARKFTESFRKVSGEFSSQKFVVFLESFPNTIWFHPESGVRRGSPKMYGQSKGLHLLLSSILFYVIVYYLHNNAIFAGFYCLRRNNHICTFVSND